MPGEKSMSTLQRIAYYQMWAIAFTSDTLDIYRIMDCMADHKWSLNGLHRPPAVRLRVAATIPFRGMVSELLKRYIDLLYKV